MLAPWHSYVTNRHRKTERRVVEGAPLSLEDQGRPRRLGERRRKNGREWARERSRSTVESKVCRGLFTDSSSWICPVQPRLHASFLLYIPRSFLFFISFFLLSLTAPVSCPLPSPRRLSLSFFFLSLFLFVSSATLDAPCITRRRSRADHAKRHS